MSPNGRDMHVVHKDDSTEKEKHVLELKNFKESLTGALITLYWRKGVCKSKAADRSILDHPVTYCNNTNKLY